MMKIKLTKRFAAAFTAVCLLCMMFAVSAFTASAEQQKGSITVKVNTSMEGLGFTIVDIGSFDNDTYQPSDDFAGASVNINAGMTSSDMKTESLKARDYAMDNGLTGEFARVLDDGCAYFKGLEPYRLYLVYVIDPEYSYSIQPLILQVPYNDENGNVVYDVFAESKFVQPDSDIYTASVVVNKTDVNEERLEGAEFTLWKKVYVTDISNVKEGAEIDSDANGNFYWKQLGGELTTNENGQISVTELPFGTYRFIEVKAPEGYVLDDTPHEFTLTKHSTVKVENDLYVADKGDPVFLPIINEPDKDYSRPSGDNSSTENSIPDNSGEYGEQSGNTSEESIKEPDEKPGFQITGDGIEKYIIIGVIVGVSFIVIILLFVLGGKKKKTEDNE